MTDTTFISGACSIPVTAATLFAGGEMGSFKNPEGVTVIITRAVLYTTTPATAGGTNLSIGVAADAVTSATNIYNAGDADDTAGTAVNCLAVGDAADALVTMTSSQYITVTGSADTVGFTGRLYIQYKRV